MPWYGETRKWLLNFNDYYEELLGLTGKFCTGKEVMNSKASHIKKSF
jgi:hypothetical protein